MPDVLVAGAEAEAPAAALAALSAPEVAPALEQGTPATERPSVAIVPVSALATIPPIPPVVASVAPPSTSLAAVAVAAAPAAEAGGSGQPAGKRLRGKAAVLAKALGLSKSRAVKQHLRPEVKPQADGITAGKLCSIASVCLCINHSPTVSAVGRCSFTSDSIRLLRKSRGGKRNVVALMFSPKQTLGYEAFLQQCFKLWPSDTSGGCL